MKFRKKPVVVEAAQWFKNGDHPADYATDQQGMLSGVQQAISGAYRRERDWEGEVVRYFRRPDVSGETRCRHCAQRMHAHGWIDTLEGGHIVCPSDWVITGVKGEHYPCKPDVFAATYEAVDQPVSDDARPTDSESGKASGSATKCLSCTATLARVTALEAEIAKARADVKAWQETVRVLQRPHWCQRAADAEARVDAAEQQIQQLREMLSEAVDAAEDYRIHSETPWVAALAAELAKLDDDGQK